MTISSIKFQNFFIIPEENIIFIKQLSQALAITYLLSLLLFTYSISYNGIIKCVLSHNIFNINSCYSIYLHSFLLMNIIPLYTYIIVSLPIYLLMHIALFPPFLAIVNTATENITVHGFFGGISSFWLFYVSTRRGISGPFGNFMFNLLGNFQIVQIVFHEGCMISHSHQ